MKGTRSVRAVLIATIREQAMRRNQPSLAQRAGEIVRDYEVNADDEDRAEIGRVWESMPGERRRHHLNAVLDRAHLGVTVVGLANGNELWVTKAEEQCNMTAIRDGSEIRCSGRALWHNPRWPTGAFCEAHKEALAKFYPENWERF